MVRNFIFFLVVLTWLAVGALGKDNQGGTGSVEGTVFVGDPSERSYVAGAKVLATGPVMIETETDIDGKYAFVAVAPGNYTVEASFSDLKAVQTVTVQPKQVVQVPLHLKPPEVKTSITVEANSPDAVGPAATETINEKIVQNAPNIDEQFESALPLVPGVVRGPDGLINMKGARNTQSGALMNSANVTDPATGAPALSLPLDVVSAVQVISNPYDPEYGKLTGAVSNVETKTGNYEGYHFSIQNILPRPRERGGSIVGIGAFTPRMMFTGPIIKDRIAITQSFEYRFVQTPVNSLPPLQRDTKFEGFNSYTQVDMNISSRQTATVSLAEYPQKLDFLGLNTFTPQPSTADYHQRGYQLDAQDHYLVGEKGVLVSQFSYKRFDVDTTPQNNNEPYQLLVDTTEGGFFNRQSRRATRFDWQETYEFAPRQFLGSHQVKVGLDYAHSSYNGRETFLPVELIGASGRPIERITFTPPTSFGTDQNETSWFAADQWSPFHRLTLDLGVRFDNDTVTSSTHVAPRAGFLLVLTKDGKTLLKGGAGVFYDRVPLMLPVFEHYPDRTVSILGPNGQVSSTSYMNRITGGLQNPRSTSWNVAVERQVLEHFTVRVGYEQRNTAKDFVVSPTTPGIMALSNGGNDSYREFEVVGRYQLPRFTVNGSYVHSRAYGTLNDPSLFFGNYPQAVIQPNASGRLPFDAPNRVLFWADVAAPWKFTLIPVLDVHTGFPYSVENRYREYLGPRNTERFPRFSSFDLQVSRPISLPFGERHVKARAGFGVFNLFSHFNPRDVQNDIDSRQFGGFYNDAWRVWRGKLVFQF